MSPGNGHGRVDGNGFPRVSGDEPMPTQRAMDMGLFSPRERG